MTHKVAKKRRRNVTLIEMMIVMFLIALITGVVAYNYRASLDEGRAFKTQQGIERIRTILLLETANNSDAWDDMNSRWRDYVARSPLANNPKSLATDGWGETYKVNVIHDDEGERDIEVRSDRFETYKRNNPGKYRD